MYSSSPYEKSGFILNNHMEATPFVFNNELFYLVTDRETDTDKSKLSIIRFSNNETVSSFALDFGLASAHVLNNELRVIATKKWTETNNSMYSFTSKDLVNFSEPTLIKQAGLNNKIFNTSADGDVIAYEVDEPGLVPFSVRFLKNNQEVGTVFGKDIYAACPTIRKINGYYYLWYLANEDGIFLTKIARSTDLINWEISNRPFIMPNKTEDINTSDVDFAEYQGKTYIFYSISDQKTYSKLTYATYNGNISTLVDNYFGWKDSFFKTFNSVNKIIKKIVLKIKLLTTYYM